MERSHVVTPRRDGPKRDTRVSRAVLVFLVGCGSRGAVDSLGQPTPGVIPMSDGGARDVNIEPTDSAPPMDRGRGFVDASVDAGEQEDQSAPPSDRATPESGDEGSRDVAADIATTDAACAPGMVLCDRTCVNILTDND